MKKSYVKPMMEIVEVQLSDCIAGSTGVNVEVGKVTHSEVATGWEMTGSSVSGN